MKFRYLTLLLFQVMAFRTLAQCSPAATASPSLGCAPLKVGLNCYNMSQGNATWSVGTMSAGGLSTLMTFSNPGAYNVTVNVSCPGTLGTGTDTVTVYVVTGSVNGCTNTVISGLPTDFDEQEFQIFPNPSAGDLYIKWEHGPAKLVLFNALGEKMYEETVTGKKELILIPHYVPGVYFVRIYKDEVALVAQKVVFK